MKKLAISIFITITIILTGCQHAQTSDDTLIGIAWVSNTDSEFYKNVTAALDELEVDYVMLSQVISEDLSYEEGTLAPLCIDEEGHLSKEAADIVKKRDYSKTNLEDVMKEIDGVIFTGGEDISPTLYAEPEEWHGIEEERDYNPTRDVSDYLLMSYLIEEDIPMLALCRGMQLLGVVTGSKTIQDIPTFFASSGVEYDYTHRNTLSSPDSYRDYASHDVMVTDRSSLLYSIVESDVIEGVPSWHHQAIRSTGDGVKITGVTGTHGQNMIEAIEVEGKRFILGIQFHPEAAIVKNLEGAENAADYMDDEVARLFFTSFVAQLQ